MRSGSGTIVVALGGNAISPPQAEGNIAEQFTAACASAAQLANLILAGCHPVITHGNGPQVGNVLRRVELAAHELYTLPLDICVADTQSGIGYMIAQCLMNELRRRGQVRLVTTIVTTVEVDPADPAFAAPTKPIGRYYSAEQAANMVRRFDWRMVEDAGRGFRRVVPSPRPKRIVEMEAIRSLVGNGQLVIAAGGGGIPVARTPTGELVGIEATIDKDRTAALLAAELEIDLLVIATEVDRVALDFGRPDERRLDRMSIAEARRHLDAGQFPTGSMGPKIEAAVGFLERRDRASARVLICDLTHLSEAVAGRGGTWIASE